ncbi:MatE efflux family protein [Oscillibacter valericigenes Sjm18-20]|nr:MatE efflux family protein [Oscillibacter valericigenes Sjm18-20]
MNKRQNTLAKEFNGAQLLRFALPTMIMMVFMGLYTIVDTIFVSHFVNTDALASINIVCPVINLTVGLGTMLATGGNAVIARNMGEGQEQTAKDNFTLLFMVGLVIGTAIMAGGLIWLDNILRLLGASDRLFPYAKAYLGTLLLFIPANILQTLFASLFVTAGKPGLGSALSICAGILNIILDFVFIALCHMGIRGAALGTGIGYLTPAAVGLIYFTVHRRGALYFCKPKWNGSMVLESCLNGSSEMVGQLATVITTLLFNRTMIKLMGEDGVAAVTILLYAQFLLSTLHIGFSMGVAPVIGYNYGSGDRQKLKAILGICLRFILISSPAVFLACLVGGTALVGLFAELGSAVYHIAAQGFRIFSFSFLFCGVNIFTSAMFTALSNGKVSAVLSFLRTFIFLTSGILLLPKLLGVTGIWVAVPAAEGLACCLSVRCLCREYRRLSLNPAE